MDFSFKRYMQKLAVGGMTANFAIQQIYNGENKCGRIKKESVW